MPFKASNNREKEKTERSYIYSHTTKHLNFTVKSKRSQSALEYMMTYGWAILIIVIVAVILYSMGIFNPSSSITTTITGFQSLGVTQAACINSVNNQILELYVTNNVGYPINLTKINVTGNNGVTVTQDIGSLLYPGHSSSFYVNGACNKSSSSYSGSVTITYMEVGQPLSGPYISTGKVSNVYSQRNPNKVAENGDITAKVNNLPLGTSARTITAWVYISTTNTQYILIYGGAFNCNNLFGVETYNNLLLYYGATCSKATTLSIDTWYFVVNQFNGSASNEETIAYLGKEGQPLSSYSTNLGNGISTTSSIFYLNNYRGDNPFIGNMSNVQIYNTALSQAQINMLYSEGMGGAPISNAGLVAWWPLDGNANDYSGNNNNGVATNVNWVSP